MDLKTEVGPISKGKVFIVHEFPEYQLPHALDEAILLLERLGEELEDVTISIEDRSWGGDPDMYVRVTGRRVPTASERKAHRLTLKVKRAEREERNLKELQRKREELQRLARELGVRLEDS